MFLLACISECVELDEESDTDLTEETPGRSCEPQGKDFDVE